MPPDLLDLLAAAAEQLERILPHASITPSEEAAARDVLNDIHAEIDQ